MDDSLIHNKMTMMLDDLVTMLGPHESLKTTARNSYSTVFLWKHAPRFAPGACSLYGGDKGWTEGHA